MTEFGEGFAGDGADAPPAPRPDKKPIQVRISLFFDGTGNNRSNIAYRETNPRAYWWFARLPGAGSYENDYSNVSRLEENIADEAQGYDGYIRVYTEGIGTQDGQRDDVPGLAAGLGFTGIRAKVQSGLDRAVQLLRGRYDPTEVVLERVVIDTCGFSRGAAAARHCVHQALNDPRAQIEARLRALRYEVGSVAVQAVGLFDTVSSLGWDESSYEAAVAELHLDAVRQAAAVYQLAAAEEYRRRFSLTSIDQAGARGRQVYLPGAHSDIGGGYREGAGEKQELVTGEGANAIAQFLLSRGWYRGTTAGPELVYTPRTPGSMTPDGRGIPEIPARVTARREAISRRYTFIPLRLMADFLKGERVPVISARLSAAYDPGAVPGRARIEAYARAVRESRPSDWEGQDPELNALRHQFLHLSFSTETGMAVRLTPGYRPYRHVFLG